MRWPLLLLFTPACTAGQTETDDSGTTDPSIPDPTDEGQTSPTADTALPPAEVIDASCTLSDNPLRVDCTVQLDGVGLATLTMTGTGKDVPPHTFSTDSSAVEHALVAWGLVESTEYTWSVGDFTGTVTTGTPPKELQSAKVAVTGKTDAFDAVLLPLDCGLNEYFAMIDPQGRIVWFEPNDVFFRNNMNGYEWSQQSRSVLSISEDRFLEQHVSGAELLALERPTDFAHALHHDTTRWGPYRYLLFERRVGTVNVDGIHVFHGKTLVDTFHLEDHFVPGTGGGDWGHGNGLNANEQGDLVLSLLSFDAVIVIDGDPASPTFLDIEWHGAGARDQGLPGATVFPAKGPINSFNAQHNASLHGEDLWLFDNTGDSVRSRAIRQRLDLDEGTLTTTGEWWFDERCRNQGGALPLDGGGVLATCANSRDVWAFEEQAADPSWTLRAACGGETGTIRLTRAIPIHIR